MKNNPFTVNAHAQVKSAEFGDASTFGGTPGTYRGDGIPGGSNGGGTQFNSFNTQKQDDNKGFNSVFDTTTPTALDNTNSRENPNGWAASYARNMFTGDNNQRFDNLMQGYDLTQQNLPRQNPFTTPDAEQVVVNPAPPVTPVTNPETPVDVNSATATMADAQAAVRDRENSRYTDPTGQTRSYSEYQEPDTVPEQTRTYGNYQENATPTTQSDGSFVLPNGKTVYTSEGNSIQESLGYENPNKAQVRYRTDGGSVEVPAARSESTFSHLAPKAPEIPLGSTFSNLRK